MLLVKVKFTDPNTGKGFIDGFRTAGAAKAAVQRVNTHPLNKNLNVMRAEYLGRHGIAVSQFLKMENDDG